MRNLGIACIAAAIVALAASQASAAVTQVEQTFAQRAASGGMAEIQAAQLAQQRASSPQVKQFAGRMLADHGQANNELQQIAQDQNITLPSAPDRTAVAAQQKLQGLNGPAFDQAYSQHELRDHEQDVALFRQEATSGQNPALKSFAQKTLPILQQHLQLAQGLNAGR
jgi:putative membrane protein